MQTNGSIFTQEEGQFCNGLRMQTEGADGNEPELPTRFHHDSQHIAGDSWREMEGRLSQKMSSAIERTVSDQPVGKYQIGLTEEGMKDIITNTVLNELGTMVRNELNAIEERIMTQTLHNMNSLVHEAVSNGKLSVSVVKDVSVEKDVQNGFYPTSSAEYDVLLVQNNKEDHLENEVSSREAFSPLRPQQKEADTLYLNRKHAATNCTDSTGCFTEDAPDLNQKLSELTKRVDALTNELRARRRSGEYCEYQERERKQAVGEDDTTVEMVKKNVTLCNEYNQPNAETDIQGIISTQNTLLQRLEQMESMFSSMSQKYSVPVVESLVVTVRELSKRLTDLTKRIDAITVVNDDERRDDLPLSCRGGDASDIEVCQAEKQHKGSLEDIISAQDDLLLRLEQMESIIILNGKTDGSSALDSDSAVSQLRCRLMEITKQVSALRSKLKEEELNPKNEKEENPHLLNHSVDHVGMVFRPRAVEQEILFEQKSHHDEEEEEVAAELLIPPKSKEDGAVVSIRPDNEVEEVTGHDVTNIPSLATEKENGGVCQAGVKEVINNGEEQLKFSSHENDIVRDAETAAPQPMQVLGLSTKSNKEQNRAVDGGMVASHREPSQAAAAINDINEVEKSPEKLMVSELPELSALDRLRAWRADIATLRKEGKQHILDSDDDLEESLCLSLNG